MIKIIIAVNGDKVTDGFEVEDTTLIENALALRRLEEAKAKLMDIAYTSEFESREDFN